MKILYAEDERAMSDAVAEILRHKNYLVDVVYDGEEALDYIMAEKYDGIILDVMMPKMSGIEVLSYIRKKGIGTPVLMLTAKSEIADKVEGLNAGADDYLAKPFAMPELIARVGALVRRTGEIVPDNMRMGNVTLDGCTVKNNSAEFCGGGIYVNTKDKVTIKGKTVFSDNSSGTDGGAVYAENGKLTVSGTSFTDNQAVVSGGAVVIAKTAEAELSKAAFKLNKCHKNGGAVLNEGNLLLKENSLTENSAAYGAGIYNSGSLTITGTEITGNTCTEKGGGIFQSDGIFTLGGGLTKIKSNTKNDDENNQNDIAFGILSKITVTGQFERSTRIGLSLSDLQTEVTTGYGKNNTVSANNYFFVNNEEYRISPDSKKTEVVIEKDPNSIRNTAKTLVEIYSDGKRISKNEYGTPADAWNKAVNAASSEKETVMTLGGDWVRIR